MLERIGVARLRQSEIVWMWVINMTCRYVDGLYFHALGQGDDIPASQVNIHTDTLNESGFVESM